MQLRPRVFRISIVGLPGGKMTINGYDKPPARQMDIPVEGNKALSLRVYVTADPDKLKSPHTDFIFRIEALDKTGKATETAQKKAVFEAPAK
jgi:hypothetical protein